MDEDAELRIAEPGGSGTFVDRIPSGLVRLRGERAQRRQRKNEERVSGHHH